MEIIGLTGFAGSGKDTAAGVLSDHFGFRPYAFADKLKALALQENPRLRDGRTLLTVVDTFGWEAAKRDPQIGLEVRGFLQEIGVRERTEVRDSIWIDRLVESIVADGTPENIVISDVRFPNEIAWVRRQYGRVFRLNRPGVGPANSHVSELPLSAALIDAEIDNSGSTGFLRTQIMFALDGSRRMAA